MTTRKRESALRLIGRVYLPRIVGLGFAFLAVSIFLYRKDAHIALWALLGFWGLVWPHLAHVWGKASADPFKCEIRNLFIDAFMIGFWVPAMSFNMVPSTAIMSMHLLSIMSVLGLRAASLGLLTELAGIGVAVSLLGFHFDPSINVLAYLVSLPMLVVYPLYVGYNAFSLSVKLANKGNVLRKLSRIDGLTGLNNRMYWEERVADEFAKAMDSGETASMVFADIDNFKQINDKFGHAVGDDVLRKIAAILMSGVRKNDLCGRYGGEEFCIMLPKTDLDTAWALAERLRLKIAGEILNDEHKITATLSLGLAKTCDAISSHSQWLDEADKALYVAKQQGRNQTVIADGACGDEGAPPAASI